MRYLPLLLMIAGCTTATSRTGSDPADASADAAVQYLVVSATDDFHQHGPTGITNFRNVRSGYVPTSSGERQYMLCGEFLRGQEGATAEWMNFVTVKTSKYEQWIGGQSSPFCDAPAAKWLKGDLSKALQTRLASLR